MGLTLGALNGSLNARASWNAGTHEYQLALHVFVAFEYPADTVTSEL
jgi:hypothetical protein